MRGTVKRNLFLCSLLFSALAYGSDQYACEIKNGNISFIKNITLEAYKREYFDSDWKIGEEEKEEKGIYPIYSMQMYNGEAHVASFAAEYKITPLKYTKISNQILIVNPWQLREPGMGADRENVKRTLLKYSNKSMKYYIELDSNPNCNINNDLIVGVYKDGVKVENTHYKINEMSPNEVKERLRFRAPNQ